MVLQKARKQGSVIVRENVIVLYLAHKHSMCYKRAAKYRTMTFSLTITDPCFLAFCTTIAFKSYIPPTFSLRKFFIYMYKIALALFLGRTDDMPMQTKGFRKRKAICVVIPYHTCRKSLLETAAPKFNYRVPDACPVCRIENHARISVDWINLSP